uniref:Uncharacterized protein n=1 Tax=Oryza punctata TaxID=4537 RepID=A0A0E0LUW7_ORYPU
MVNFSSYREFSLRMREAWMLDLLARFIRLQGRKGFFISLTEDEDEHGLQGIYDVTPKEESNFA